MNNRIKTATILIAFVFCVAGSIYAQQTEMSAGVALNIAEMKFAPLPGMPTCATGAVSSGDPTKGASIILAKATKGCTFPNHWHTPNEKVMIVSGSAHLEMKDGKPASLRPGGFADIPSKHVHSFKCTSQCMLFIHSDAPFDMHYVDASGNELSADDALKAVGEKAAKAPAE
jgi:quercetin dioxygenase-like cupin family protein